MGGGGNSYGGALNGAIIGTKPNKKMTFQGSLPHIRFLRDFAKVLKQLQIACIFP